MPRSSTHLLLVPSYNTGRRLVEVIESALGCWQPVLVVIDGSTDGSDLPLRELAAREPALTVLSLPRNSGKGAAVLAGLAWARAQGFTHALAMDADGQHPAAQIGEFMDLSRRNPDAMILGQPVFPPEVPIERLHFRKLSILAVHAATLGHAIADPLYGFRVYPVKPLLDVLGPRTTGRRYDFDAEAAVRLFWAGIRPINVPSQVRYFAPSEGGVSHYRYLRDNIRMTRMHAALVGELIARHIPAVLRHRRRWAASSQGSPSLEAGREALPSVESIK